MKKEDPFLRLEVLRRIYGVKVITSMYEKARETMKISDSVRHVEMQLIDRRRHALQTTR